MNFEDLKFVQITGSPEITDMVFRRIPRELFEQVKDIEFNIDLLYQAPSRFIGNANTRFYVLTDDEDVIKGILWAYINILTESIDVHILSIDKEFQFGDAIEKTLEFIRSWQGKDEKLKIQIITARPHAYEKAGFVKSKRILLEI